MVVKVAHVITRLDTGGAETALYRLLCWQSGGDIQSEIYSLTSLGKYGELISRLGVPVRALGLRPSAPNPFKIFQLASWLRASRPDVVQTWMYHADLVGGLAAVLAGRLPVVWGIHHSELDVASTKPRTIRVAKACAALSHLLPSRVICCSTASIAVHVAMGYARKRMVLIPNGVDIEAFKRDPSARTRLRTALKLPDHAVVCGMVARYHPVKNFPLLVDVAKRVTSEHPHIRFLICGPNVAWENAELSKLIASNGLTDRFLLLGPRNDVPAIMNAIDVLISTSSSEAFPLVIAEAMAAGTPCIVTDVGDSALIVGDTGRVAPAGDADGLARACREVLQMPPAARQALGDAARRRIESHFSAKAMVDKFSDVLQSVIHAP